MIYIYSKQNGSKISEHQDSDKYNVILDVELYNNTHTDKIDYIQSDSFPPSGMYFIENYGYIYNSQKLENGLVVERTIKEKYDNQVISEFYYRSYLYEQVKQKIYDKFEHELEYGFFYANLQFQATEESTNRIGKAVALVDKGYSLTNEYLLPIWVSNTKDENDNDKRYAFSDYNDLINFSIQIGLFWQECFFNAKNLCDRKIILSIDELENYDIDSRW